MTIGERIKELRKKNDLTQEKLAVFLNVSFQAVSKWECGISSPDLALIGPLTKVLRVTADELLGLDEKVDTRKAELDKAYDRYRDNGDWDENYHAAAEAVRDYPGDFRYLEWLATSEYMLAYREGESADCSMEFYTEMIENAIRHYDFIIENCREGKIRDRAHVGMLLALKYYGRTDEAMWYAEIYPEEHEMSRDEVMGLLK